MSQVVLRCYDFPSRLSGRLFGSLPGSTLPSSVRVSQLALALPEGRRVPAGPAVEMSGGSAANTIAGAAAPAPTARPQLNRDRPLRNGGRNRKDAAALSMLRPQISTKHATKFMTQ